MRTGVLLAAAVVFGLVAALLAGLYLKSREAAIRASLVGPEQQTIAVVVARSDLPRGTRVATGDFAVREMPADFVHPDAVRPNAFSQYEGRVLTQPLAGGRPLLLSFLDETFPVDFSDTIPEGRRAMTVQVDEINSIAGFVRPGNRIDVLVNIPVKVSGFRPAGLGVADDTVQAIQDAALAQAGVSLPPEVQASLSQAVQARGGPSDVVLPVLQDVRVLAAGVTPYRESLDQLGHPQRLVERRFTSVTLDVSPQQAALLAIAEDKGQLLALLRNRRDRGGATYAGITAYDLVSNAEEMKRDEALRQAAAKAGARIDENGNWIAPDGTVVAKEDLRISADGTVTTASGKLLASKDVRINEKGEYEDANGNVLTKDANGFITRADGTVITPDGKVVRGKVNEQGFIVDADGTVRTADGRILEGVRVNENGQVVDANGNVLTRDENGVITLSDGRVITATGEVVEGKVNAQGYIVGADGTVRTPDGKILQGARVDENGNVVGADGQVLANASEIRVGEDGVVRDAAGNVIAGITAVSPPPAPALSEAEQARQLIESVSSELERLQQRGAVDLIAGGKSKDGVATVGELPLLE